MSTSQRQLSVLLADDDPFIVSLYRERLMHLGHRVDTVQNGEEAIRRIQSTRPDLLVLDLNMPRLDGTHVLRYIREQSACRDLPVIVLSNACSPEFMQSVNRLRPTRFLVKHTIVPKQVLTEIQAVLNEVLSGHVVIPVLTEILDPANPLPKPAETVASLIDDFELSNGIEVRRDALLHLYRYFQEHLQTLKSANVLSLPFQFGEILESFFERAYEHPETLPQSTSDTLRRILKKKHVWTERIQEGPAPPELVLIHAADAPLRAQLLKICTRPGLQPIGTAHEDSAADLVTENPFNRIVWQLARASALRKTLRLIQEIDRPNKPKILFIVSNEDWAACRAEIYENLCVAQSLPLLEPELLANLYVLDS